jgi:DNA polymerase sigma
MLKVNTMATCRYYNSQVPLSKGLKYLKMNLQEIHNLKLHTRTLQSMTLIRFVNNFFTHGKIKKSILNSKLKQDLILGKPIFPNIVGKA